MRFRVCDENLSLYFDASRLGLVERLVAFSGTNIVPLSLVFKKNIYQRSHSAISSACCWGGMQL